MSESIDVIVPFGNFGFFFLKDGDPLGAAFGYVAFDGFNHLNNFFVNFIFHFQVHHHDVGDDVIEFFLAVIIPDEFLIEKRLSNLIG